MKRLFRIYWPFAANEIKRNFVYKGSFYLFIIARIFSAFITYYLWMAIYGSTDSNVLGGFTRNEMIVYVFMSYVTSGMVSIGIAQEIGYNVVEGSIAMNLIKPIEYRRSLIFKAFGNMVYRFVVPNLFIWVGVELYRFFYLGLPIASIPNIILFLCSCFCSFLIYVLFDFCFGMLAFFTTYIWGMAVVKNAILSFLTGQLIPLSFFPESIQRVFDFLPFSSMVYVPVMIYLGKYTGAELVFVLARQVIWIVILSAVGSGIWKIVTKRLIVLGG